MREKLFSFTSDFWIEDELGGQAFLVDGSGPFSREAFTLRDADGGLRAQIRRKAFAWRETLRIEDGSGADQGLGPPGVRAVQAAV